jgi:hypothetical protein
MENHATNQIQVPEQFKISLEVLSYVMSQTRRENDNFLASRKVGLLFHNRI